MPLFIAELVGTFILILLGNGVVANVLLKKSKGFHSGWIVISFGWGLAVAFAVYAVGWISGAHINPAVTMGFAVIGKITWSVVPYYLCGQMIGAFLGAIVVWLTYYNHFYSTPGPEKLLCFSTKPAIRNDLWNFITEVIATAVLLFGILAILDRHNAVATGPCALSDWFIDFQYWSFSGRTYRICDQPSKGI